VVAQVLPVYRGDFCEAARMGVVIVGLAREYEVNTDSEWGGSFEGASLAPLVRTSEGIDQL
jgi:hypothetical protein